MRIVATSDLHGFLPEDNEMPEGDLLVIAGDIMPMQHSFKDQIDFLSFSFRKWLRRQSAKYSAIIGIGGNHDFLFDRDSAGRTFLGQYFYGDAGPGYAEDLPWIYLENAMIVYQGLKIYGTPYVPNLLNWAFYKSEDSLKAQFRNLPPDIDLFISHGPPYSCGDTTREGDMVGSWSFMNALGEQDGRPGVIFGHIHEGYGSYGNKHHNVSYVDRDYVRGNPPIVFDLEGRH